MGFRELGVPGWGRFQEVSGSFRGFSGFAVSGRWEVGVGLEEVPGWGKFEEVSGVSEVSDVSGLCRFREFSGWGEAGLRA